MERENADLALSARELGHLSARVGREAEKRLPYLAEYARATLREMQSEPDLPQGDRLSLLAAMPATPAPHAECLPPHRPAIGALLRTLGVADRVACLSEIFRLSADAGEPFSLPSLVDAGEPDSTRVAYVRNPLTDEAYDAFSAEIPAPTVLYTDSFREACEAVRDGSCGFCILPYENLGGLLASFSSLASRYGLTSSLVCRVFHADGGETTHFALYARKARPDACGDEPRLRFSFRAPDAPAVSDVFTAAALTGGSLLRADVSPDEDAADELRAAAIFRFPREKLPVFLGYLRLFTPEYRIHGLYKEIEK